MQIFHFHCLGVSFLENMEQFDEELQQVQEADATEQAQQMPRPNDKSTQNKKESWQKTLLTYMHDLVYLLAALIVISMVFLRVVVVSGSSMYNTLVEGDYLLVLSNVW